MPINVPPPAVPHPPVPDEKMPEPPPMVHAVNPPPVAHQFAEDQAWNEWRNYPRHTRVMRRMIQQHDEGKFVKYNPLLDQIEPIVRAKVTFRKRRVGYRDRVRYVETHELHPHPLKRQDETDIHAVSRLVDPLHGVVGTPSKLGSYIQLKVLPNILNICIKKGVQKRALYLLAKRLLELDVHNNTHVLIKRARNGRFVFKSLYSSKQLKKHTFDSLAEAFWKLIKNRKYVHLIAKPNSNIYNTFDEKHILK